MAEFRQWHEQSDGRTIFCNETMVYFSQCGADRRLSLGELLRVTSDTAVQDWAARGISRERLASLGVAVLVSRCSFRLRRMPAENERIVLRTWEEKSEPLQFVRAYEIDSVDGTRLVDGVSTWLLVDIAARRILPIRRFDAMNLREPTEFAGTRDCLPAGKIAVPEGAELFDERVVRRSDIDSNGHTNNARYGAFAADALPGRYAGVEFTDFRINYAKEAMLGEPLKIFGLADDGAGKLVMAGRTDAGVSFEAEFRWDAGNL